MILRFCNRLFESEKRKKKTSFFSFLGKMTRESQHQARRDKKSSFTRRNSVKISSSISGVKIGMDKKRRPFLGEEGREGAKMHEGFQVRVCEDRSIINSQGESTRIVGYGSRVGARRLLERPARIIP